jgi:DNA-binding NarL/FixJ family response regulator
MATAAKAYVGIVTSDPLRSLGLVSILEEMPGVSAAVVEFDTVMAPESGSAERFTALMVHQRATADALLPTIARIRRARPGVKLMIMGEMLPPEDVQTVIGAGAKGYLADTATVKEIVMATEIVLDGSIWAPRKVLAALIDAGSVRGASQRGGGADPIDPMLTDRERDVLNLLMNGRSNREIAAAMGVEAATVKAHIGRMLRKTKASNRVELTLRAMEDRERQK